MKDFCICNNVIPDLILPEHHICTRVTVEGEISVSVRISMYKGKCCVYLVVDHKVAGVDPYFLYGILKLGSEHVVSDFADECSFFAKLLKHCKHVAWSTARIGFQHRIPLCAASVFSKVNQ